MIQIRQPKNRGDGNVPSISVELFEATCIRQAKLVAFVLQLRQAFH